MDSLAPVNESYHDVKYWDERYQKEGEEGAFDWFKSYKDVAVHIRKAIPNQEARIIMLGCGNSGKFSSVSVLKEINLFNFNRHRTIERYVR